MSEPLPKSVTSAPACNYRAFGVLALSGLIASTFILAQPAAAQEETLHSKAVVEREMHELPLGGKLYREAEKALAERRYDDARRYLQSCQKEINRGNSTNLKNEVRLGMARLDLAQEQNDSAFNILEPLTRKIASAERAGANGHLYTVSLSELGEAEIRLNKFESAEKHLKQALSLMNQGSQGSLVSSGEKGKALGRLAKVYAHQGLNDDAKAYYAKANEELSRSPGYKDLDLADLLRWEALFYRNIGSRKTAGSIFDRSAQLREVASHPQKSSALTGQVDFIWEPGAPHSREIIDQEFPLRYIEANNIRVAVTCVDLWELAGLLVCVTNTDEHRHTLGLGDVKFYRVVKDPVSGLTRSIEQISEVDHRNIDRIRRERTIWDLTQNRPWLANIQKTRNVRGLVPPKGHDLFRGPNVFGVWGEWPGVSHTVPTRVSIFPSRENVFSDEDLEEGTSEDGLIRSEGSRQIGLLPISMEPLESRTGEKFYLYPRDQDVEIKVTVGNTIYTFPFHCRKKRIN